MEKEKQNNQNTEVTIVQNEKEVTSPPEDRIDFYASEEFISRKM